MAIGTSPAIGTLLFRAGQPIGTRIEKPIVAASLVVATTVVLIDYALSDAYPARLSGQAARTAIPQISSSIQIVWLAMTVTLGCVLAMWPTAHVARVHASDQPIWMRYVQHPIKPLFNCIAEASAALMSSRTTAGTNFSPQFPLALTQSAPPQSSAANVAQSLAKAWTQLWGHQLFGQNFEIEASRGSVACSPDTIQQVVNYLLVAAALREADTACWRIRIRTENGTDVAAISGHASAWQRACIKAKNINAPFAITMADALIQRQSGELTLTTVPGRAWQATITLPGKTAGSTAPQPYCFGGSTRSSSAPC